MHDWEVKNSTTSANLDRLQCGQNTRLLVPTTTDFSVARTLSPASSQEHRDKIKSQSVLLRLQWLPDDIQRYDMCGPVSLAVSSQPFESDDLDRLGPLDLTE